MRVRPGHLDRLAEEPVNPLTRFTMLAAVRAVGFTAVGGMCRSWVATAAESATNTDSAAAIAGPSPYRPTSGS
jgi:hypothetical protein